MKSQLIKQEDGTTDEIRIKCSSKFNTREIEFKHAEYREQNRVCFLCESHYTEVFGEVDQEERKAFRDWQNARTKFNREYAMARAQAEYFEPADYKEKAYKPVQNAYEKWKNLRKRICRYEDCDVELQTIRRVFVIRTYSARGTEWASFYICCKDHWMKFMYRIGIEQLNKKDLKINVQTLDDYR